LRASKSRILIGDYPPTRLGIRIALDGCVTVCGEAGDAFEAVRLAAREQPDVCVVGLDLPGGGIMATRGIRDVSPESAVVVLATTPDPDDLLACVRAGAIGYVPTDQSADSLRRVIAAASEGEATVPRSMVRDLIREIQGEEIGGVGLTEREAQVLRLLRRGVSTSGIAGELNISPVTVRRHVSSMLHKAGVRDRAALEASA
jgi:DNA-binding NarL/FixJ family response regulator